MGISVGIVLIVNWYGNEELAHCGQHYSLGRDSGLWKSRGSKLGYISIPYVLDCGWDLTSFLSSCLILSKIIDRDLEL